MTIMQLKINKRILFPVCLAMLVLGACTKKLDTNNNDPNGLSLNALSAGDLFSQALLTTVTNKVASNPSAFPGDNYDFAQEWMGYWSRNFGYSASGLPQQIETFTISFSNNNGTWVSLYHNAFDYSAVMAKTKPGSLLLGAARVMRVMIFQDLVDQFGNVPYSQALKPQSYLNPAYDSASAIYKGLVKEIDTAIAAIQASSASADDASDIMFKGNKNSWLAFANTMKLRLLLRQVPNVYAANDPYITSELSQVTAQGGFLGAGQDALINPGFQDVSLQQSPFWSVYGYIPGNSPSSNTGGTYQNRVFFGANTIILDSLTNIADPRIGYFFYQHGYPSTNGGYVGNALGRSLVSASLIGPGVLNSPSAPALLFSASQSLFMQAEAAQRGMLSGNAKALFQQAVEESFRYLGAGNAAAADAFVSGSGDPMVNIAISSDPLQTILVQKWVAECGLDGYEAYSDYRRTGYPTINTGMGALPERLLYPETEYTQNPTNVNAQYPADQSSQDLKIFWEK